MGLFLDRLFSGRFLVPPPLCWTGGPAGLGLRRNGGEAAVFAIATARVFEDRPLYMESCQDLYPVV